MGSKKPVLNVYTHNNRLWLPTKEHITQKLLAVVAVKRFVFNLLILVQKRGDLNEGEIEWLGDFHPRPSEKEQFYHSSMAIAQEI